MAHFAEYEKPIWKMAKEDCVIVAYELNWNFDLQSQILGIVLNKFRVYSVTENKLTHD